MMIFIVYLAVMLVLAFAVLVAYGAEKIESDSATVWLCAICVWPITVFVLMSVEVGVRLKKAGRIK